MAERNRRFLLHERPQGRIGPTTFDLVEGDVPQPGEGEALVRTEWISLDPTNRGLAQGNAHVPAAGRDRRGHARRSGSDASSPPTTRATPRASSSRA